MKASAMVTGVAMLTVAVVAGAASGYAGDPSHAIAALSPDEVAAYRAGAGMGYARAAERNSFPGPRHVLDLADELGLSEEQVARSQALFDAMQRQAADLGRRLIAKERELDRQFAAGTIDAAALDELVAAIGSLEARIRATHLRAHLDQKAVLTAQQVQHYDRLRGYESAGDTEHALEH